MERINRYRVVRPQLEEDGIVTQLSIREYFPDEEIEGRPRFEDDSEDRYQDWR